MDVSIIILTKNEERSISQSLPQVFSQEHHGSFEVILIDSGSTDRTLDVAKRYPVRLIQIEAKEFHHSRTRNLGANLSKGEIIVYLAGDAHPQNTNWLKALISNFDDTSVAAVYGRQIPPKGVNPVNQFRIIWNYGPKKIIKSKELLPILGVRIYYFSTVNCAIRKSVWESFKFPEDLPVYEDTAFIKNVIHAGYKVVYEPEAKVYHAHNYSILDIFRRYFDTGFTYKALGYFNLSNDRLKKEGISYLKSGIAFLAHKGYSPWIPYFIAHTAAGFLGLTLGKNADKLPHLLRKLCSRYGV